MQNRPYDPVYSASILHVCRAGLSKVNPVNMLGKGNQEYFIIILLCIVSANLGHCTRLSFSAAMLGDGSLSY